MSIGFIEGFDWPAAVADLELRWGIEGSGEISLIGGRSGEAGSGAIRIASTGTNARVARNFPHGRAVTQNKQIMFGFAMKMSGLPSSECRIFEFIDTTEAVNANIAVLSTGELRWNRGTTTTVGDSTFQIIPGAWHYVEIFLQVRDVSSGTGELRMDIDGTNEITIGPDSTVTVNDDRLMFYQFVKTVNGETIDFDDFYIGDPEDGAVHTDILGDVTVEPLVPDADGTTNDWTANGGSNNFDRINTAMGVAHDGDTTYVDSQTGGEVELYALPAPIVTAAVSHAVAVNVVAKKNGAGGKGPIPTLRSNSVNETDSGLGAQYGAAGDYVMTQKVYQEDPNGGAPTGWTPTTVGDAEIGFTSES